MDWKEQAIKLLKDSLYPRPTELNQLDWKSDLSNKSARLAQHLSAFANMKGGGVLVYGVHNDGTCFDMEKEKIDEIIQTLGNIARNNLMPPVSIEHAVIEFENHALLFVYIPEHRDKPVYLRGEDIYSTYYRSAGATVKMPKEQVKVLIATSKGITFEEQIAKDNLTKHDVLNLLDYKALYRLLDKNIPQAEDSIIECLESYKLCTSMDEYWGVTNLGAILFANELKYFSGLVGREVIVRKYVGTNNREQEFEQHGTKGYAVDFESLIDSIIAYTSVEKIGVTRAMSPMYPRIAIREFVANALVHQDFGITGMPVTIEIFSNRIAITNAGAPLNDINRLIDLPPQSRNERLAKTMFELRICERRGSGIDRAIEAIESMYLPPVEFSKSDQHTRVSIFPRKKFTEMTKSEKVMACYQHACLKFESREKINNQSVRERFELSKKGTSVVSRIIADTMEAGFIKPTDTETTSKKYMTYIPYYG